MKLQREASVFKAWVSDDLVTLYMVSTSIRCLDRQCYDYQHYNGRFSDCVILSALRARTPGIDGTKRGDHVAGGCLRYKRSKRRGASE
jgi:hypothetical protein